MVVFVWFLLVVEQIYNQAYVVNCEDGTKLYHSQLKAILYHALNSQLPYCLLQGLALKLHANTPFLVEVLCLFVLRNDMKIFRLYLRLVLHESNEAIEPLHGPISKKCSFTPPVSERHVFHPILLECSFLEQTYV